MRTAMRQLFLIFLLILFLSTVRAVDINTPERQQAGEPLSPTSLLLQTSTSFFQSSQTKALAPQTAASQLIASTSASATVGPSPSPSISLSLISTSESRPSTASSAANTTSSGPTTGVASGVIIFARPTNVPTDRLPSQPKITPAFGIAGLILILSGIPYAFIGVRGRWMHISFSVAYLSALAITILIIYVATPPISEAVQGAYFVAVFVPACILGGLALVFPEATQGLACLLGGFCLSMWFMVWKSGGLITAEGGRVAFIVALSIVSFSLSFTRYTRTYALMGCTAFAGSTATVLGIDCFSRAGLKEFWVFIWGLNSTLFPVGTVSYPSTHGIRAEAACIVIMTFCGVLSQTKLWKIYKRRRDRQAADRAQDEEDRRHLEGELGRQLEHANRRERAQWEAIYGDKEQLTASISNFGSSYAPSFESRPNTGISTQAVLSKGVRSGGMGGDVDVVEMAQIPVLKKIYSSYEQPASHISGPLQPRYTQSDFITVADGAECSQNNGNVFNDGKHSPPSPAQVVSAPVSLAHLKHQSLSPSVPPPPTFVSVPFPAFPHKRVSVNESDSIPVPSEIKHNFAQTEAGPDAEQVWDCSEINDAEEDVASSVVGTWDGQVDDQDSLPPLTRSPSPTPAEITIEQTRKPKHRKIESASDLPICCDIAKNGSSNTRPYQRRRNSAPLPDELQVSIPESLNGRATLFADVRSTIIGLHDFRRIERISDNDINLSKSSLNTLPGSLRLQPSRSNAFISSRVTQPYWTNEWAKQLQKAELPVFEELQPTLDGISIRHGGQDSEIATPVNIEELQQTANRPIPSRTNSILSRQAYPQNAMADPTSQRTVLTEDPVSVSLSRNPSKPIIHVTNNGIKYVHAGLASKVSNPLQRSFSQPNLVTQTSRNLSSTVLSQSLVESPIEEAVERRPSRSQSRSSQVKTGWKDLETPVTGSRRSTSRGFRLRSRSGRTSSQSPSSRIHDPATNYSDFTSANRVSVDEYKAEFSSFAGSQRARVNSDNFAGPNLEAESNYLAQYQETPASAKRFPRRQSLPDFCQPAHQQQTTTNSTQYPNLIARENMSNSTQSLQWCPQLGQHKLGQLQYVCNSSASPDWSTSVQTTQQQPIYDSHQPRRTPSFNAIANESRLADWYISLQADAHFHSSQLRQSTTDTSHFNNLYEQFRRDQQLKQRTEEERGLQELLMDQRMRTADMLSTHRSILRKMEAEVRGRSASIK